MGKAYMLGIEFKKKKKSVLWITIFCMHMLNVFLEKYPRKQNVKGGVFWGFVSLFVCLLLIRLEESK